MKRMSPDNRQVLFAVALAFVFWYLIFSAKWMNFWLSMSIAVSILTGLTVYFGGVAFRKREITFPNILLGIGAAVVLYGIFWVGNFVSQAIFHFARPEIAAIYNIRHEWQALGIALVLLFVTSPGEELFWRGFLQNWAMGRFGPLKGWLLATAIYAAVHVVSGNIMLIGAALVAGLFWGFLYWRSGSVFVCIVSHAFWTVGIFVIWPVL